jgi:hypothetical protein
VKIPLKIGKHKKHSEVIDHKKKMMEIARQVKLNSKIIDKKLNRITLMLKKMREVTDDSSS